LRTCLLSYARHARYSCCDELTVSHTDDEGSSGLRVRCTLHERKMQSAWFSSMCKEKKSSFRCASSVAPSNSTSPLAPDIFAYSCTSPTR
jgi:hypothetical protein